MTGGTNRAMLRHAEAAGPIELIVVVADADGAVAQHVAPLDWGRATLLARDLIDAARRQATATGAYDPGQPWPPDATPEDRS